MRYPRVIGLGKSFRMFSLIAAIHLVAAIAFAHLSWTSPIPWLGLTVLALSLLWHAMRPPSVLSIELGDDGRIHALRGEVVSELRVDGVTTDFGWAIWLVWWETGHLRARLLLRADHPPEDWRALAVWLRHKRPTGGLSAA